MALLVCAGCVSGQGQSESKKRSAEQTLVRWHFVGTKELSNNKDLPTIRDILKLKESQELRDVALQGFAMQAATHFSKTNATNINAQLAALIKPLLPDLIENESRFEMGARGANDADWALALKLPPERFADWNRSLSNLAVAARMQITAGKGESWSAQLEHYRLIVSRSKDGLLMEGGFGPLPGKPRKFSKSGKELLTAEINAPAIAALWNAEQFRHAPKLTLRAEPRKGQLRSEMLIDYPQPLNITPEKWNVPMSQIHEPLIGFTAIQGIRRVLEQNPQFKALHAEKTPNQAFLWNQGTAPFTVFAAADVGNPAMVVSNIVQGALPFFKNLPAQLIVPTNRPAVLWRGLPIIVPFFEAAEEGKSPFLTAGLFPISEAKPQPAPPELFAQLERKKLIYYDWEITQERLNQWRPLWQLAYALRGKILPPSASDRWIEAVTPKLINTVTEGTLESPTELKLIRQSQTGLSAVELLLLAHALDPNDVLDRPEHPPGQTPGPAPRRRPLPPPQRTAPRTNAPAAKH